MSTVRFAFILAAASLGCYRFEDEVFNGLQYTNPLILSDHMDYLEIFRSVEIVWILWFVSWLLLGYTIRCIWKHAARTDFRILMRRIHWSHINRNQNGAAYSLAFILVLPFLIFLIAMIIETSFMLVAKLGTMHAAFASARTATVWSTGDAHTKNDKNGFTKFAGDKARQAAVTAMVPYAAGSGNISGYDKEAETYWKIYNEFQIQSPTPKQKYSDLSRTYIQKKYKYAAKYTNVKLSLVSDESQPMSRNAKPWEKNVQAEVSYEYPFHIFPVGKALGARDENGSLVYKITSTALINNECPWNDDGCLGIKIYP